MDGSGKVEESGNRGGEWPEMRVVDETCCDKFRRSIIRLNWFSASIQSFPSFPPRCF